MNYYSNISYCYKLAYIVKQKKSEIQEEEIKVEKRIPKDVEKIIKGIKDFSPVKHIRKGSEVRDFQNAAQNILGLPLFSIEGTDQASQFDKLEKMILYSESGMAFDILPETVVKQLINSELTTNEKNKLLD